jgi:hypothetical protein
MAIVEMVLGCQAGDGHRVVNQKQSSSALGMGFVGRPASGWLGAAMSRAVRRSAI